jgi:hypothetical protein
LLSHGFNADLISDTILSMAVTPSKGNPLEMPSSTITNLKTQRDEDKGTKKRFLKSPKRLLSKIKTAGTRNKQQQELSPVASDDQYDDGEGLLG